MMKQFLFTVIIILTSLSAFAQSTDSLAGQLDRLRIAGYEALYNLDYERARFYFHEMIRLAPDHPAGPQCLAASIWLQQLNESWELKATLYSAKSYNQTNNKIDAQRTAEFRNWIRNSKQLSEARLRRDSHDQEALYLLGAAEGLEAAFSAAVERKFMSALRSGSDSVDHHRAVLKVSPDFHDAELTIGLYNYIVGALPLPLKMLVGSMGVRGSKKRGLETLERVATEGHWARDVARVLLIDLYKREKRWTDAIKVSQELIAKYPRNYLFKLQLADALTSRILATPHSTVSSVDADEIEVNRIFGALATVERSENSDLIHFRYGETLLLLGNSVNASKEFQVVLNYNGAEPGLQAMSRLRMAQCLDLAGKRNEALAMYRQLLGPTNGKEIQDEARRGLREPFKQVTQIRRD
jgi:tetratricopeptide (TPR) repeat protein